MRPPAIVFYCGRFVMHLSDWNKGYVYLPEPPRLNPNNHVIQADNLDHFDTTTQYTAYKPIEGHWYLYYRGGD